MGIHDHDLIDLAIEEGFDSAIEEGFDLAIKEKYCITGTSNAIVLLTAQPMLCVASSRLVVVVILVRIRVVTFSLLFELVTISTDTVMLSYTLVTVSIGICCCLLFCQRLGLPCMDSAGVSSIDKAMVSKF